MIRNTTQAREDSYTAAMTFVHEDEAKYLRQICCEFAVGNMGQDIKILAEGAMAATYAQCAWDELVHQCEVDISGERSWWQKDAKKMIAAVKKAKLPFTLENARLAWEKKGPFVKK